MELKTIFILYGMLFTLLFLPAPGVAQSKKPLEIKADNTLEWHRDRQEFIARGNVVAKQGTTELHSERMKATYQKGQNKQDIKLQILTATGSVVIHSANGKAFGDQAEYDVTTGQAVLRGDQLKLTTPQTIVTAEDRFEYDIDSGKISGYGNSQIIQSTDEGQNTIEADVLSAIFATQQDGERTLKTMSADGNVVITTPTEVITGNQGTYNRQENIVILKGEVTIQRGANTLEGEIARVDLNKNISTLFGDTRKNKRVRGLFFPGED